MRNTLLVARHEVISVLGKASFWLTTFLLPVLIIGSQFGGQLLAEDVAEETAADVTPGNQALGYVDPAGIVETIPSQIPPELLLSFPTEDAARAAMDGGDISGYYVISADYVATGELTLITSQYNPLLNIANDLMEHVVNVNLVGDEAVAQLVSNPLYQTRPMSMAPEAGLELEGSAAFLVPYAALFIFFFVITMTSGFILQSVAKEKETRVVEVLLVSLRPREMMLGKVLGMGAVGLLQIILWLAAGAFGLGRGASMSDVLAAIDLPPGFVAWSLVYFVLGYLLYSSVMAALGAMAPTMREGQQFTFVVLLPLMIPMFLVNSFAQTPNGSLPTILSLFPLTAPVSMVTRLVVTDVPLWQLGVSVAGLAVTAYLVVLLAARLFQAQTLLSDAALNLKRIWQSLRGE